MLLLRDELVLFLIGIIDLSIEEEKFFLQLFPLGHKKGQFSFIVFALIAEEHVGLDEFEPFLLQFFLSFDHPILDLLLVGARLELVEFLLGSDQFIFILLDQLSLFLMEMRVQFHVEVLNQRVEVGFCVLDCLDIALSGCCAWM